MATYGSDEIENDGGTENSLLDAFRSEFKKYKRKRPPPDYSEVVDFDKPEDHEDHIEAFNLTLPNKQLRRPEDLIDVKKWKAYRLKANPGFLFIVNPFARGHQRYWVRRCLQDYPNKPNVTNLDIHVTLTEKDHIWDDSQKECSESSDADKKAGLLSRLRWVTLGYHYEWNNRVYFEDSVSSFPQDLSDISKYIAAAIGFEDYSPEAGIVNYYNMDSALCPHTDHSEFDHESPLISFSFGQSAVFLIGGESKAVKPVPLYLKSGDICVMMNQTRLAYHAVPKILPANTEHFKLGFCEDERIKVSAQSCCDPDSSDRDVSTYCAITTQISDKPTDSFSSTCGFNLPAESDRTSSAENSRTVPAEDSRTELTTLDNTEWVEHRSELAEQNKIGLSIVDSDDNWAKFEQYVKTARINVNVRQVLKHGQQFPSNHKQS